MRNPPTDRDRLLSASALCLCTLAVVASATALESSLSTAFAPAPSGGSPNSGLSLLGLLFALLDALLSMFGLSLEGTGGRATGQRLLRAATAALATLYRHRLGVVAGVAAVTALGLAVRTRGRVRRWAGGVTPPDATGQSGTKPSDRPEEATEDWPDGTPKTEVARAWVEMARELDVTDPHALTPAEWQAAAVEAGLDPGAVRTITAAFRTERYGSGTVSRSQSAAVRRASSTLSRDGGEQE
jgi:hypothetical protein